MTVAASLSFVFQERSAKIGAARLLKNIFMMYISAVVVGGSIPPPSDFASIKEANSGRFYDEAPFEVEEVPSVKTSQCVFKPGAHSHPAAVTTPAGGRYLS